MNIVVLGLRGFPGIQGGVETHGEQLYTRIASIGHCVTVFCRTPYMVEALTEYCGVRLISLPCPRWKFMEAIVHTFLGVIQARFLRPDILHIHAVGPSLMVPLARLLGMRVVVTNHGPDYLRDKWNVAARMFLRLGESLGSRYSNGLIAISLPIAEHLESRFKRRAEVIPNGVNPRAPSEDKDALERYGIGGARYFLAVGRLVPEKGLHDLVDAFVRLRDPDWKLVIVGAADHEDSYSIGLRETAALHPSIVMTGFLTGEPLHQIYSHAAVFVLPSYHEGFPIVLLEAMGCGLQLLASDIRANRQVGLPDDQFFPPGDVVCLTAKLREFKTRSMAAEDRLRQARFVSETYDWNRIAHQTIGLYESLFREHRPPPVWPVSTEGRTPTPRPLPLGVDDHG